MKAGQYRLFVSVNDLRHFNNGELAEGYTQLAELFISFLCV